MSEVTFSFQDGKWNDPGATDGFFKCWSDRFNFKIENKFIVMSVIPDESSKEHPFEIKTHFVFARYQSRLNSLQLTGKDDYWGEFNIKCSVKEDEQKGKVEHVTSLLFTAKPLTTQQQFASLYWRSASGK